MAEAGAPLPARHEELGFLFEMSPAAVVLFEPDGAIVDANDRAVDLFGYDLETLDAMDADEVLVGPEGTTVTERWQSMDAGERQTIDGRHRRGDGSVVPAEISIRRIELDGEERVLTLSRERGDVGSGEQGRGDRGSGEQGRGHGRSGEQERILTEDELDRGGDHRSRVAPEVQTVAFLRTILDVIDDVLYVIDERGDLILWNEALAETTGYSHEEIAAMPVEEFIPEDQQEYVPGLLEAIEDIEDRRVEVDIRTKDGERITHEFSGTTFEDPRAGETYRCGTARDVTERRRRERELEEYETIIETIDDGVYVLDEDLRFTFVNDAVCRTFDASREELLGTVATDLFSFDEEVTLAEAAREQAMGGTTTSGSIGAMVETSDGLRRLETRYRLHPEPDGEYRGSIGVARDVTEREERERTLRRQRDELATMERLTALVLETVHELIQTSSREAVERTVCERVADSEFYSVGWIGERAFGGDEIVPRVVAGDDAGFLDSVTFEVGDGSPAARALASGEVEVVHATEPGYDPWRGAAIESGTASIAAVPLRYADTVYGVLEIHSPREDSFSEREQTGFEALGRTVGFVIHAARSRDLLFADTVVELAFDTTGVDVPLLQLPGDVGCSLELNGYVSTGDAWLFYLSVDGASPSAVVDAAAGYESLGGGRVITEDDEGGEVELALSDSSLLEVVGAVGGRVTRAWGTPEESRIVVEAPADIDVREVVRQAREEYPPAELISHRERDRDVSTVGRPDGVLDALTDRQREAIEIAYRSGYFAWPRESSAQEVAESIGIDSSTLHGHLRKAENRLLSALLDDL